MKKFSILLVIFLCPLLLYGNVNLDQLEKTVSGIAVEVMADDMGKGYEMSTWVISGFFLNEEGYILTSKFFLRNKKNYRVNWIDPKGYIYSLETTVASEHPTENAIILKVEHPHGKKFPTRPLNYAPMKVNSWVFLSILGFGSEDNYPVAGKIIRIFPSGNTREAMIAIPRYIGGLGSAIFDFNGSVIGLFEDIYEQGSFICGKPLLYLKDWIEETVN